jgi:parallel beta-helix repeat protein
MAKHWGQLGLMFASTIALGCSASVVEADAETAIAPRLNLNQQNSAKTDQPLLIAQQGESIIFVAPNGTDISGAGTQAQPFRTITAALSINPQPGTVIQLAAGNYNAENGEVFPIKLPPGIVLRGNSNTRGEGVTISGGGKFISPTFASQTIAMLAENDTTIDGITLTNSNFRGYALWVESKRNVVVSNSTFSKTTHDGIFLTGDANVAIVNSLFTQNRGSGISAVGTSSGEIRGNTFDNTGFGLSIGQKSQVSLVNNRINNNVDGIIISNVANPILRSNTITNNNRNGIVILKDRGGQPAPDLGTANDPGRNSIRDNKVKDIHNISGIAFAAAGNELNRSKIVGPIDTVATSFVSRSTSLANSSVTLKPKVNLPAYSVTTLPPRTTTLPPRTTTLPPRTSRPKIAMPSVAQPSPISDSPASNEDIPTTILIERDLPPISTSRPRGKIVERQINTAVSPPITTVTALPPVTPTSPVTNPDSRASLRYRVIVPVTSTELKEAVRRLVPNAFTSRYKGRSVIQTGAYSDRAAADEQAKMLLQSGFQAIVTPMNS